MQRVLPCGLHRLVVLRERAVVELRRIEATDTLREHDERAELAGWRVGLDVRDVAHPLLAVPHDAGARRIPGLPVGVGGGAVVHDAPVGGPREAHSWNMPRPVGSALLRRLALFPAAE